MIWYALSGLNDDLSLLITLEARLKILSDGAEVAYFSWLWATPSVRHHTLYEVTRQTLIQPEKLKKVPGGLRVDGLMGQSPKNQSSNHTG